jgi:hypothetical protein
VYRGEKIRRGAPHQRYGTIGDALEAKTSPEHSAMTTQRTHRLRETQERKIGHGG